MAKVYEKTVREHNLYKYLDECIQSGYLKETQVELGKRFSLHQREVSDLMNAKDYHRDRNGTFYIKKKYLRQQYLDSLQGEMTKFVSKNAITSDPTVYVINCQQYLSDQLKHFIEISFPRQVVSVFTNYYSIVVYLDPTYTPENNELVFSEFLSTLKLKANP